MCPGIIEAAQAGDWAPAGAIVVVVLLIRAVRQLLLDRQQQAHQRELVRAVMARAGSGPVVFCASPESLAVSVDQSGEHPALASPNGLESGQDEQQAIEAKHRISG